MGVSVQLSRAAELAMLDGNMSPHVFDLTPFNAPGLVCVAKARGRPEALTMCVIDMVSLQAGFQLTHGEASSPARLIISSRNLPSM